MLYALMITDVLEKGTELLVAGDVGAVARTFGVEPRGQHDRAPGRDEPQEAGRAEAARVALSAASALARRRPTASAGASPHSCSSR